MAKLQSRSAEEEVLLAAAGRCLQTWSGAELYLAHFFANLHIPHSMGNDALDALRAAFDAVVAFEARLQMVDTSVARSPLVDDLVREHWPRVSNRLAKKYKKRHAIAHFSVWRPGERGVKQWSIQPFPTFTAVHQDLAPPPLSLSDLEQRAESFAKLAEEVRDFAYYMALLPRWTTIDPAVLEYHRQRIRGTTTQNAIASSPPPPT